MTTWTNGPPTEPGVYWVRAKGRRVNGLVRVERYDGDLVVDDWLIGGRPAGLSGIRKHQRIPEPSAAHQLQDRILALEPNARAVVEAIVARLELGHRQYGPLDLATDTRDWRREAWEEALDAAAYLAMGLVSRP